MKWAKEKMNQNITASSFFSQSLYIVLYNRVHILKNVNIRMLSSLKRNVQLCRTKHYVQTFHVMCAHILDYIEVNRENHSRRVFACLRVSSATKRRVWSFSITFYETLTIGFIVCCCWGRNTTNIAWEEFEAYREIGLHFVHGWCCQVIGKVIHSLWLRFSAHYACAVYTTCSFSTYAHRM